MSTIVYPPLPHSELPSHESETLALELNWLLSSLQETLQSLKDGLTECATLLAPRDPGSTLALSTLRSESLKGFVTRVGTRIVKGDVQLRLQTLPVAKSQQGGVRFTVRSGSGSESNEGNESGGGGGGGGGHDGVLILRQLVTARSLIDACLDVVDAARWTVDQDSRDAEYMSAQLRLLHENVGEARVALRGGEEGEAWCEESVDETAFDPPLPHNLSFHFSIADAALRLHVRTLEVINPHNSAAHNATQAHSQMPVLSLRERLSTALTGAQLPASRLHDEVHQVFTYRNQQVRVREKIRVESQDPSLMACLAKLGALEHTVALGRRALDVVMGRDGFEEEG